MICPMPETVITVILVIYSVPEIIVLPDQVRRLHQENMVGTLPGQIQLSAI